MLGLALLIAAPAQAQFDAAAYARARAADAAGSADIAVIGYAQAMAIAPDDPVLAARAYRSALSVGDYGLASRAGAALVTGGTAPPDLDLLAFAIAVRAGDMAGADRALERLSNSPLDFLVPSLGAWLAYDRGADPFAKLSMARGNPLAERYVDRQRPLIEISLGLYSEASVSLARMPGRDSGAGSGADLDLWMDAALLYARAGKTSAARDMLGGGQADLAILRDRPLKSRRAGASFGMARLLDGVVADIRSQDIPALSIVLTRVALLLDPGDARAQLRLADALSRNGSSGLALGVLDGMDRTSAFADEGRSLRIAVLGRAGRSDAAMAQAERASRAGNAEDAATFGDLLAESGNYPAAVTAYATALKRHRGTGGWELHYAHGIALDRAGRWAEALPALRRAVEAGPDQPQLLRYLGYAQVERGEDLAGAQTLLERARALSPKDAGIADALAWAYFRRGDLDRALPLLEEASRGDPSGTRSNEHLGDAYWSLGRRYEARYAWRAATIHAEKDAVLRIEGKLVHGL